MFTLYDDENGQKFVYISSYALLIILFKMYGIPHSRHKGFTSNVLMRHILYGGHSRGSVIN